MSMLDWRYYPKIARIARMAGADVGRGSETLMTYSRGDLFRAARHVRAGNHVEQRLVVAERPTTEAFAHIAVHIDSHSRLLSVCFLHSHRFHSFRRLSVVSLS